MACLHWAMTKGPCWGHWLPSLKASPGVWSWKPNGGRLGWAPGLKKGVADGWKGEVLERCISETSYCLARFLVGISPRRIARACCSRTGCQHAGSMVSRQGCAGAGICGIKLGACNASVMLSLIVHPVHACLWPRPSSCDLVWLHWPVQGRHRL